VASELVWRNRESLPGQSLGFQENILLWQTPFLEGPAKLRAEALLLWQAPQSAASTAEAEVWQVRLKNGDVLRAQGLQHREDGVSLTSKAFGDVLVQGAHLHSAIRCRGDRVIYAGPQGAEGWQSNGYFPVAGAGLATQQWNALAELSCTLPEKVSMRVVLHSLSDLQFVLSVGHKESTHPSLEVWDRDLVLVIRVGQVGFQAGFVFEGHEEAMGVALSELHFNGLGRAPLESRDSRNFPGQLAELRLDVGDLLRGGVRLELEEDHMPENAGGLVRERTRSRAQSQRTEKGKPNLHHDRDSR
jgi:hypothetical protein